MFSFRGSKRREVAGATTTRGKALLVLGKIAVLLVGIASTLLMDLAIQKYVTPKLGYRVLALAGATLLSWFIVGSFSPLIGGYFAAGSVVAAVIVIGVEVHTATTPATPATAPATTPSTGTGTTS